MTPLGGPTSHSDAHAARHTRLRPSRCLRKRPPRPHILHMLRLSWEREASEGLELGAGMTGTPSSEGRGTQQCVPLTRPWLYPYHHRDANDLAHRIVLRSS